MQIHDNVLKRSALYRAFPIALAVALLIAEIVDDIILNNFHIDFYVVLEAFVVTLLSVMLWSEINQREQAEQTAERAEARSQRLAGDLAEHIEKSFEQWRLSQAEHDIAWLLLKGFSFAEIADLRGVKEKTLRQQASRIYTKGKVTGRSELAATFLQDLLLIQDKKS